MESQEYSTSQNEIVNEFITKKFDIKRRRI